MTQEQKRENNKKWYQKNKERLKPIAQNRYQKNKEEISKKSKIRYEENKEPHKQKVKEWNKKNEEYLKQYQKEYNEKNKDYINGRQKDYNEKNREHKKQINKEYYKKNKNKCIKRTVEYIKNRLKTDPSFKLIFNIRSRFGSLLKSKKIYKFSKTLEILSESVSFYKNHLESQFLPEFTWKNYGVVWEIDHIIPCSKFDLTDENQQKQCFHYTNLQPLFKTTKIAESFGYFDQIGNRNKGKK